MAASAIIETPRLRIVSFCEDYLTEGYVAWLNDKELTQFSQQRFRQHTLDSCRNYMKSFVDSPHYFWAIVARDEELGHIGNINAYVDKNHQVADVGIIIGERRAHGTGMATEAWSAVCRFLLNDANIRKVTAGTLSCNLPMLRIMEKTGMVDDGRRTKQQLCHGVAVDVVHMAIFKSNELREFEA